MLSALAVSREGVDVRVEWGSTRECRADFFDLFEPVTLQNSGVSGEDERGAFCIVPRHWWNAPQSRRNLHIPALVRRMIYDAQYVNAQSRESGDWLSRARARNNIYVSTGYEWYAYDPELARVLMPVASIRSQIERLTKDFDAHTIGVHIRRTDNVQSKRHSTDEAFVQTMREALLHDENAHFFVATDDLELLKRLKETFPNRISSQSLTAVRRDTREGIRQAVVDLFCLARCARLIGSYWSSFTDMAAEISGKAAYIVGAPE